MSWTYDGLAEVVMVRGDSVRVRFKGIADTETFPASKVRMLGERLPKREKPRPHTTNRSPLRVVPKISKPVRNQRYLEYIRSHPCMECGTDVGVIAHHSDPNNTAMGRKVSDFCTVALCQPCHQRLHDGSGTPTKDEQHREQHRLMVRYLSADF